MNPLLRKAVEKVLGAAVVRATMLGGGSLASVSRLELDDGRIIVAKRGDNLAVEAWMLRYLSSRTDLPVPDVLYQDDHLLLMGWIDGTSGGLSVGAERDLAGRVARLHDIGEALFGLERDTVIGPLVQPNPAMDAWPAFFAEHRLLHMARLAMEAGHLPVAIMRRIEMLAERIDQELDHGPRPSLLHGDLWGGNILSRGDRVTGLIDPAIYYGDAEIELAFMTLFQTVGSAFFEAYLAHRPLAPGFFERRRRLYLLYPLLVHTRLFGGSYAAQADRILKDLGY
ncbi:MAG: fructosamine kinase [Alphaproteobacteria bacterium]|nr:MAG: fructosamine kinase [Alphaproteobacteria bacterium]